MQSLFQYKVESTLYNIQVFQNDMRIKQMKAFAENKN